MPSVSFAYRLLFDKAFYDIIKLNASIPRESPTLLFKLMHINAHSKEHRRQHNIMSNKSFNNILSTNTGMSRITLRAAFYPINEPVDIEAIEDEVERNIKHSIDLTSDTPYKVIIMTSDKMKETYESNGHFKSAPRTINILSDEQAVDMIRLCYSQCERA